MTALSDFIAEVNDWINFEHPDTTVTRWVRMAEERLSTELRVAKMIQLDTATIFSSRVLLPSDWEELDFVRSLATGKPLHYITRDEMFSRPACQTRGKYTMFGDVIHFGGEPDSVEGSQIELSYYGSVPVLGDDPNWVTARYNSILLAATMFSACAFDIEDERAPGWDAYVTSNIQSVNDAHKKSRISGSTLVAPLPKSFG